MPWQQRGSKRYFYRSERVAGRPVRRYVGAGDSPAAALAATTADLRRLEREVAARESRAERERLREAEAPLLRLCEMTDALTRAALFAAGFKQHDRGVWRRCRETERAE
jgi:hypothetical protein